MYIEEQGNCNDFTTNYNTTTAANNNNNNSFSFKQTNNAKILIITVIIIVLYTTLIRIYLRSCGNLTGSTSINVILARYGPTISSICVGGYILLSNSPMKNIQKLHIDIMAIIVYLLLFIQIIVASISPLMTHVLSPSSSTIIKQQNTITLNGNSNSSDNLIPEIFHKMKKLYDRNEKLTITTAAASATTTSTDRRLEIPIVYGLATVYSSILISFGVFFTMMLVILLEPKSSIGLIISITVGGILLTIHSILRYRTANNFETCIQPTFTAIVGWFLLGHFCFFATSHQTTLSQIDWRAAFVGRTANIGNSNFISGILVILNTFCGQIFFMIMYGLLSTETFSIFALFPTLIKSNVKDKKFDYEQRLITTTTTSSNQKTQTDISIETVGFDMTRGELILFENETVFLGTVFKLAIQFYMLQGIKIFCAMLACTIHCRHLMVWKIFAPRFIYESLATFVGLIAIILGYLLIVRIHWSVDRLINRINKIK